ncbi:mercury methylation ferredoxin HgcB [candidate division KSB1 bacterium]
MTYLKNVVSLTLDPELCNGCGICLEVCPHEVLATHGKRVRIAERDQCIECGACSLNCVPGAIKVDAGVGCASAYIGAAIKGSGEACCGSTECC